MSRPVGSKNKPKQNNTVRCINLNKNIKNSPEVNDKTPYKWIPYGRDNKYPLFLLNLYYNSIIHHSCIDFLVNSILGDGIDYEKMKFDGNQLTPNSQETWENFIMKISFDLVVFGAFSFQIIRNRDGKTFSFYHQPFSTVRLGKKNENGVMEKAYLCKDWSNFVENKPIEIDILTPNMEINSSKPFLFVYQSYNPIDEYYGLPHYIGAISAIESEISMKTYDLMSIKNNFTSNGIVTLNQVNSDEERDLILRNIEAMFKGEENANKLIIAFRNSLDDKPIEYTPISANVEGVNLFSDTNERCIARIISAHRIASKALIGLPMDNSGFSSEGYLLEVAYNLTNKLIINNFRQIVTKVLNKMLNMNGIEQNIILKPLSFIISNTTDQNTANEQIADNNNNNETNN